MLAVAAQWQGLGTCRPAQHGHRRQRIVCEYTCSKSISPGPHHACAQRRRFRLSCGRFEQKQSIIPEIGRVELLDIRYTLDVNVFPRGNENLTKESLGLCPSQRLFFPGHFHPVHRVSPILRPATNSHSAHPSVLAPQPSTPTPPFPLDPWALTPASQSLQSAPCQRGFFCWCFTFF